MKLCITERPSAVPAARAQVVATRVRTDVPTFQVPVVGRAAVWPSTRNGAQRLPLLMGTTLSSVGGFAGSGIDLNEYGTSGASGVPPRGRPV